MADTKAVQTYERVEKLVADGLAKADAFKQLAEERKQSVDSVRGAYYSGRRQKEGGSTGRARRRTELTTEDAIAAAVASLEKSIATIEQDVRDAGTRADEAVREHGALSNEAGPKINALKAKIEGMLKPEAGGSLSRK